MVGRCSREPLRKSEPSRCESGGGYVARRPPFVRVRPQASVCRDHRWVRLQRQRQPVVCRANTFTPTIRRGTGLVARVPTARAIRSFSDANQPPTSFGEDKRRRTLLSRAERTVVSVVGSRGGGRTPAGAVCRRPVCSPISATLTPASGFDRIRSQHAILGLTARLSGVGVAIPASAHVTFSATGNWTFPVGTVIVKHFEMEDDGRQPEHPPSAWRRVCWFAMASGLAGGTPTSGTPARRTPIMFDERANRRTSPSTPRRVPVTWAYSYPSRTELSAVPHSRGQNRALRLDHAQH